MQAKVFSSLYLFALLSYASVGSYASEVNSSAKKRHFNLSQGEVCTIPERFNIQGADYRSQDLEDEETLCSFDVHLEQDSNKQVAVGACAKLNSTFPAVELIKIPSGSKKSEIQKQCSKKAGVKNGGKLAKYKYSMSCAKSASIIGYYHVSRALGIKYVPPSVHRTMDLNFHTQVAEQANTLLSNNNELISKTWRRLLGMLNDRDKDIVSDNHSYGILSKNVKGEQKTYAGIYLGGSSQDERLNNFMNSSKSTYQKLRIRKPIVEIVGTSLTDINYATIQQMKDVSDMIILDTIFGQRDRFANTHSIYTWLVAQEDGNLKKLTLKMVSKMVDENGLDKERQTFEKAKNMPKDWRKEIRNRRNKLKAIVGAYLYRQGFSSFAFAENLILKDNDCGLKGSNPFMSKKVIENTYHVSPETYEQLIKLYTAVITDASMDEYLRYSLRMNSTEMIQFKKGLAYVAKNLMDKKKAGELFLDLTVKSHLK